MASLLGDYFKKIRLERGLTTGKLALLVGYSIKSQSKGANTLHRFESTGLIREDLLERLAAVLVIDWATVEELMEADCRRFWEQWEAWVSEPIKPYIVVRLMPAILIQQAVPAGLSDEQAERFASSTASTMKKRCCLVLSRRLSIYFNPNGSVEKRCEATPGEDHSTWMQIGIQRFLLKLVKP